MDIIPPDLTTWPTWQLDVIDCPDRHAMGGIGSIRWVVCSLFDHHVVHGMPIWTGNALFCGHRLRAMGSGVGHSG